MAQWYMEISNFVDWLLFLLSIAVPNIRTRNGLFMCTRWRRIFHRPTKAAETRTSGPRTWFCPRRNITSIFFWKKIVIWWGIGNAIDRKIKLKFRFLSHKGSGKAWCMTVGSSRLSSTTASALWCSRRWTWIRISSPGIRWFSCTVCEEERYPGLLLGTEWKFRGRKWLLCSLRLFTSVF